MLLTVDQMALFVTTVIDAQTEPLRSVTPDQEETSLAHIDKVGLIAQWKILMGAGLGVAFGVEKAGKPAGFLLGVVGMDYLCNEKKAWEFLFMVSPGARSGGTAKDLLREFEFHGTTYGCKSVVMGLHETFKPEAMRRFYRSQGYWPISEAWEKRHDKLEGKG